MDGRKKRRVLVAGLLVVLLLLGFGLYFVLGMSFTISFNPRGGSAVDSIEASPRQVRQLRDVVSTRPGWTLRGWIRPDTGERVTSTATLRGDITLEADWAPIEYTLNFLVEGSLRQTLAVDFDQAFVSSGGDNNLEGATSQWIVRPTISDTFEPSGFLGWEFHVADGTRRELLRNNGAWTLQAFNAQGAPAGAPIPMNGEGAHNRFYPLRNSTTFHAIIQHRYVSVQFQTSTAGWSGHTIWESFVNSSNPSRGLRFGYSVEIPTVTSPSCPSTSYNFAGWQLQRHPSTLHAPVNNSLAPGFVFTNIDRYDTGDTSEQRTAAVRELNSLFQRTWLPGETVVLDPLLYYLSSQNTDQLWRPEEWPGTGIVQGAVRLVRFVPVFFGTGSDGNPYGTNNGGNFSGPNIGNSRFFMNWVPEVGESQLIPIDDNSRAIAYARTDAARIVLYRPADRIGRNFLYFSYFNEAGIQVQVPAENILPEGFSVPTNTLAQRGIVIFEAVWEFLPVELTFDFGSGLTLGHISGFIPGGQMNVATPAQLLRTEMFTPGDRIVLPQVTTIFMHAYRTFSHWEVQDGARAGFEGGFYNVQSRFGLAYTLRAIWLETEAPFIFNTGIGGWPNGVQPNLTPLNRPVGETVHIPNVLPEAYGHTFLGWRAPWQVELLQPGAAITVQSEQVILVAQWQRRAVRLQLEFSRVFQGQGSIPSASGVYMTIDAEFNQIVTLPTISNAAFLLANEQTGWAFATAGGGEIVHNLGLALEISREFTSSIAGGTAHADFFPSAANAAPPVVVGIDTNEGRRFGVEIWSNTRQVNPGYGLGHIHGHTQLDTLRWSAVDTVGDQISHSFSVAEVNSYFGASSERATWFANRQLTHSLYGVLWMPTSATTGMITTDWMATRNNDTGIFGTAGPNVQSSMIRRFNQNGEINNLVVAGEPMSMFLLWKPHVVEIQIIAYDYENGGYFNIDAIESFFATNLANDLADRRNETNLASDEVIIRDSSGNQIANVGFELFRRHTGAFALPTEREFDHWAATFIWANGHTETANIQPNFADTNLNTSPVNWIFADRNDFNLSLRNGHPVSRVELRRVTFDENDFIVRMQAPTEIGGLTGTFGVRSGAAFEDEDFSIFSRSAGVWPTPQFHVNDRLSAAAFDLGLMITGFRVVGDPITSRTFNIGETITIANAPWNAETVRTVTLTPIVQSIQFRVAINWERSLDGVETLAHNPATDSYQFTASWPEGGSMTPSLSHNSAVWTNAQTAFPGHFIYTGGNTNNLRLGNELTPRFRLGEEYTIGINSGQINPRVAVRRGNYYVIDLWIHYTPRPIIVEYFAADRMAPVQTVSGITFGQQFNLLNPDQVTQDSWAEIGHTLEGWRIDPDDVGSAAFTFGNRVISGVTATQAAQATSTLIGWDLMPDLRGNAMVLQLHAHFVPITITSVMFHMTELNVDRTGSTVTYTPSTTNTELNFPGVTTTVPNNGVITFSNVAFGSVLRVDTREGRFTHSMPGIYFHQWAVNTGTLAAPVLVPIAIENEGRDLRLNAATLQPIFGNTIPTVINIHPYFGTGYFPLFGLDHMHGINTAISNSVFDVNSLPDQALLDNLRSRIIHTLDVDPFSVSNTQLLPVTGLAGSPATIDGADRFFQLSSPLNLYTTFIQGSGFDNRFVRWGYELTGFYADVRNPNTFAVSEVRFHVSGSTMLNHLFLADPGSSRPRPLVLRPIWEARDVELRFQTGEAMNQSDISFTPPGQTTPVTGLPTRAANSGTLVGGSGSVLTTFESLEPLPILRTGAADSRYMMEFGLAYVSTFPGGPQRTVNHADFGSFRVRPGRHVFFEESGEPRVGVPTLYVRPNWNGRGIGVEAPLQFNFRAIMGTQLGSITDISLSPANEFMRMMPWKPAVDPNNPNAYWQPNGALLTNTNFNYVPEPQRTGFVTAFQIPQWTQFTQSVPPLFAGHTPAAWYRRVGNSFVRFADLGAQYVFFGDNPLPLVVDNNQVNIYLRFETVEGNIQFDSRGGTTVPNINNVNHGEAVNISAGGRMNITRHERAFVGWRLDGFVIGTDTIRTVRDGSGAVTGFTRNGTAVVMSPADLTWTLANFNFTTTHNTTNSNFTPIFPTTGFPLAPGVHTHGMTAILEAVWETINVPLTFMNADATLAGGQWNGVTIPYNAYYLDYIAALTPPTRTAHRFLHWSTSSNLAQTANHITAGNNLRVTNRNAHNLHAVFTPIEFRFQFMNDTTPIGSPTAAFTWNQTTPNNFLAEALLPTQYPGVGSRDFLGWSLHNNNAHLFNPALSRQVRFYNESALVGNAPGLFHMDMGFAFRDTNPQTATGVVTFNLYATWSQGEVTVSLNAGVGGQLENAGNPLPVYSLPLFGAIRNELDPGGTTVGAGDTGHQMWGFQIPEDHLIRNPDHNFIGWRPSRAGSNNNWFTDNHALNRLFFPGDFLPSINESIVLVAQWAEWNVEGNTTPAPHPDMANVRVVSLRGDAAGLAALGNAATSFGVTFGPDTTTTNIVAFPRGDYRVMRNSVTITGRVDRVIFPTFGAVQVEAGAVVSDTLTQLYVSDNLLGFDRYEHAQDPGGYTPSSTIFNIVAGVVNATTQQSSSAFVDFVVRRGQPVIAWIYDNSVRTGQIDTTQGVGGVLGFMGYTDKYTFGSTALITRSRAANDGNGMAPINTLIPTAPELIASPAGAPWTAILASQFSRIHSYAFMTAQYVGSAHVNNPVAYIARRAFYSTNFTGIHFGTAAGRVIHPEAISGFQPNLVTVTGGTNANQTITTYDSIVRFIHPAVNPLDPPIFQTVMYVLSSYEFPILQLENEGRINQYALSAIRNVRDLRVSGSTALYRGALTTVADTGLHAAHFGGGIRSNWAMDIMRVNSNVGTVDWTIFHQANLGQGLVISGAGISIINGSVSGDTSTFPIFADTWQIASDMTLASGIPSSPSSVLTEGGSTVVIYVPRIQTLRKWIRLYEGVTTNDASGTERIELPGFGNDDVILQGDIFTMPERPAHFEHTDYVFVGWRLPIGGWGQYVLVQPGQRFRIGMEMALSTPHASGLYDGVLAFGPTQALNFIAHWAYADGLMLGFNEEIGWTAMDDVVMFDANSNEQVAFHEAMTTVGGEFLLPGSSHAVETANGRAQFVGWMTTPGNAVPSTFMLSELPNTYNFYAADGIMATAPLITGTRFWAVYDFASDNVAYRFTDEQIFASFGGTLSQDGVAIPAFVQDRATTFMRPVTDIEESGFTRYTGTGTVTIGRNVGNVGRRAFEGTRANNIVFRGNQDVDLVIAARAFANAGNLENVALPANTAHIGDSAFADATQLESVTLSNPSPRLEFIGASAFAGASNLTSFFQIPQTVEYIGVGAFTGTDITQFSTQNSIRSLVDGSLTGIQFVAINNLNDVNGQGHLAMKDMDTGVVTLLVFAPGQRQANFDLASLRSRNFVTSHVANNAFYGHAHLNTVTVPMSVQNIDLEGTQSRTVILGNNLGPVQVLRVES